MSTYQHKPGKGSLFPNDRRETSQHPSHKGKLCMPNGELRWLSAWVNDDGRISVSVGDIVQPKQEAAPIQSKYDWKAAEAAEPRVSMEEAKKILEGAAKDGEPFNDEIPF